MFKAIFKKIALSLVTAGFLMVSLVPLASAGGSISTPSIVTPVMNQVLTDYPRVLTVWWGSASGAASYTLEVACDFCASTRTKWLNPTYYNTPSNNHYYEIGPLAGDNQFRVRVRGVGADGDTGQWSDPVYFSFKTSAAVVNSITIKSNPAISSGSYDADNGVVNVNTGDTVKFYGYITGETASDGWKWDSSKLSCTPGSPFDSPLVLTCESIASGSGAVWLNANFKNNQQISSNVIYVKSASKEIVPPKASIVTPVMNQVLTNYPRVLTVWWGPTGGGAVSYTLEVACDYCASTKTKWLNPTYYTTDSITHYWEIGPLAGDNQFRVRVQGTNAQGTKGEWSDYVYFTYKTEATYTPPTPPASNPVLPPAGYEDKVLTNASNYKNPFPDTSIYAAEGLAAAELYRRGVIGGYADGEFKGYKNVNRAEAAKFLMLARYGDVADYKNDGKFWDVLDGQWYTKFVVAAYKFGVISGYPDGSFGPANNVNTAEFLKMLTLAFSIQTNLPYTYYDVPTNAWYKPYVGAVQKYNLLPDRNWNYLEPGKAMTRKDVAIAIYQYLQNR